MRTDAAWQAWSAVGAPSHPASSPSSSPRRRGRRPGVGDATERLAACVPAANIRAGAWTLLMRDMSASLVIRENADPAVLRDLQRSKQRLAPGDLDYEHDTEGPDDMPAHVRSALTSATLTIPVLAATLSLGTWQARCL